MRFTAVFSTTMALAVGANAAGMAASEVVNNLNGITDISSDTNDIAKSISAANMFQTAPQVVDNFKRIVDMVSKDIDAMKSKRDVPADAAKKVQGILERDTPADAAKKVQGILERDTHADAAKKVQGILERRDVPDVGGVAQNPGKILGGRKRQAPGYSDMEQSQICDAFHGFAQVQQDLLKTVTGKQGVLSQTPLTQPVASVLRSLEGGVDTIAFGIIDLVPNCAEGATNDKINLDSTLQKAQDTYN